jgi:NitT/TauT family transport system permease protein
MTATTDFVSVKRETTLKSFAEAEALASSRVRRKQHTKFWSVQAMRAGLAVALVGGWELGVSAGLIDAFYLPPPSSIVDWVLTVVGSGELWHHLTSTLTALILAFTIGSAAGILVGLLFGRFETLEAVLAPLMTLLNSLPRVALAPLFILYLGIGIWSKVAVGIGVVFFIMMINTRAGIRSADPEWITLSKVLGHPQRETFMKIMLPSAVPAIFAGLQLAAVYALLGVVVGELVASEAGLGQLVQLNSNIGNMPGVFGTLLILSVLALTLATLMRLLERRLLRWQDHKN